MKHPFGSDRAAALASDLRRAANDLAQLIETIEPDRWDEVPAPGQWSVGKEVDHAFEAVGFHTWIVRRSLGDPVASRRPTLDRRQIPARFTAREAASLLRRSAGAAAELISALSEDELNARTKPPRATAPTVADAIERILVGHLDSHRASIAEKLLG